MDLLATRWANPYLILDDFIRQGQLHELITQTLNSIAEELIRKNRWEYYIHCVCLTSNMSFEEYVTYCEEHMENGSENMTSEDIGSVISDSMGMLELFK